MRLIPKANRKDAACIGVSAKPTAMRERSALVESFITFECGKISLEVRKRMYFDGRFVIPV